MRKGPIWAKGCYRNARNLCGHEIMCLANLGVLNEKCDISLCVFDPILSELKFLKSNVIINCAISLPFA